MALAARSPLIQTARVELAVLELLARERLRVAHRDFRRDHVVAHARDARRCSREAALDQVAVEPDRFEDLRAAIGLQRRDSHLRERLEQALVVRLDVVVDRVGGVEVLRRVGAVARDLVDRLQREVGVDRGRAIADQERHVRYFARVAGLADDSAPGAQRLAHQMMVYGARREQHRDRREIRRDAPIGEDQDVHSAAHRALGLGAQAIERGAQSGAALGDLEQTRQLLRAELGQRDVLEPRELLVGDHRVLEADHARVLFGLLEQIAFGAERREQRHHGPLVDRVHRRVRDLREALLEVPVEHLRAVGQTRERRVFTHRADRPLALHRHRREQDLHVLHRVSEHLLQREGLLGVAALLRHVRAGQVGEQHAIALDPVAIRAPRDVAPLDLLVADDPPLLEIDEEDLPGMQPLLDHHVRGIDVEHAHFRRHHDEAVLRHHVARRPQAVAVEHGADLAPVGEGERSRAVPRLHQKRVELVVAAQVGIHLELVFPGLGDHHQDRFGQLAARQHQEFERVVEARRIGRARAHDRIELGEVRAEQARRHRALARVHPVLISLDRVDLAVVREVTERMGEVPRAERVGAVAGVHQAQRRLEVGIADIREEALDLPRDQHPRVDERAAREAGDIEEVAISVLGGDLLLREAADHVELALERILISGTLARRDEELPDAGHALAREPADRARVAGDLAPSDHALPLARHDALEDFDLARGGGGILREEDHAHRITAGLGELDLLRAHLAAQEPVGHLYQESGAVPGLRIATAGTAVLQVHEHLDALRHDVVRLLAADVGDEPDATGVVFVGGIVKALFRDPAESAGGGCHPR